MSAATRAKRKGLTCVEFAIVANVTLFLILSMMVGALGIFRYDEVAHLAREGARFASNHGGKYHQDGIDAKTGVAQIATSDDMRAYLLKKAVLLDPDKLTIKATWSGAGTVTPSNTPIYTDSNPNLVPPAQLTIQNYVTVTVTYEWFPELYRVGPITLTSTSTMAMAY
jgi:Flp pilus assembly protein TadG